MNELISFADHIVTIGIVIAFIVFMLFVVRSL